MENQKISVADFQDTPEMERKKEMTFELTNRSKSAFVKKGDERSSNPRHLNSPRVYLLPMKSRIWSDQDKRWVSTQYVPGANTIYVDDVTIVNSDGKLEKITGLKNQGYNLKEEYQRAVDLSVKFEFGLLQLEKYGNDPLLYEFISKHEDNEEAPSFDRVKADARKFKLFLFRPLQKEKKAQAALATLDDDAEALNFVRRLRTQKQNGTYTYNAEMIDALLGMLGEGAGLDKKDFNQKLNIITRYAKADGAKFNKMMKQALDDVRLTITLGVKFGLLSIGKGQAILKTGTQKGEIMKLKGTDDDAGIVELSLYLLGTEKGAAIYNELWSQIEIEKIAASKQ